MPSVRSQRGFTMALALAMAVVMGILLLKAAPNVIKQVQHENEAELIFRGEAIANAIRIYFAWIHRYPKDLDEILKVRPHILRQKYKDPMTTDGEWEYLTQVQPGASGNTEGLPIVGVRSRSLENSIRIYQGKEIYHDWKFSADQNLLGAAAEEAARTKGQPKAGNASTKSDTPKN